MIGGKRTELLGVGQKSGVYWALNPDTGEVVWQTQVGPGAALGGIEWGTSADGKRISVGITNYGHVPATITSASEGAVVGGAVYWGSGYHLPESRPANKLYAFSLPNKH